MKRVRLHSGGNSLNTSLVFSMKAPRTEYTVTDILADLPGISDKSSFAGLGERRLFVPTGDHKHSCCLIPVHCVSAFVFCGIEDD